MRYYAVAVGRKQMITTKYREYRKLVKGYPDAKYLHTDDLEKAEEFIKRYNSTVVKKDAPFYEETISYTNCFMNPRDNQMKDITNAIWIVSSSVINETHEIFNPDFQFFTREAQTIDNAVAQTIMTSLCLNNLEEDIRSKNISNKSKYNFYKNETFLKGTFKTEHNLMMLDSLTDSLKLLITEGQDNVYIVTDSHYLANLLIKDVFANQVTASYSTKAFEGIYKLYSILKQFDRVYISRYNPDAKGIYHQKILKNKHDECRSIMEGLSET